MNIDLSGKTVLITGGASGIGRQCALTLAEAGASIVAVDVNLEGAQETISQIGAGLAVRYDPGGEKSPPSRLPGGSRPSSVGEGGLALRCDLGDPQDILAMRDRVLAATGGVDALIHCAGIIAYRQGIGNVPVQDWDRVLDVNLRGVYLVCQAFMEHMKGRGNGRIVTFSSLAARVGGIEVGVHYTASKAALIGLTRSLAKEGGPYGITANAVAPGIILTEVVQRQIAGREADYHAQIPLRRLGTPQDVANVVLFLVSPLAAYVSGVVLDINGGQYMG